MGSYTVISEKCLEKQISICYSNGSYMTDGSGEYHREYNCTRADRLGMMSGAVGFFLFERNRERFAGMRRSGVIRPPDVMIGAQKWRKL